MLNVHMEIPYRTRGESRILGAFFPHKQTLSNLTRILGLDSSILSCDSENKKALHCWRALKFSEQGCLVLAFIS